MQNHTKTHASDGSKKLGALILRAMLFAALLLPVASPPSVALAVNRPVTITIYSLSQLGDDFDTVTLGDFYANVIINGVEQSTPELDFTNPFSGYIIPTGNLLETPWVITQEVPEDDLRVPVTIQVRDSDWPDPNDTADINPGPGETISFWIDVATGQWTGDVNWPVACSTGPTDIDGDGVEICFDVNTVSVSGDLDEDGVPDNAEQRGVDFDSNDTIDLNLPAFGSSPFRKDVYVEVDCLAAVDHTHCPLQTAIADVVSAFARAPVPNFDGTSGVQLHVDTGPLYGAGVIFTVVGPGGAVGTYGDFGGGGNQIAEVGNTIIESFNSPKGNGTPFATLKASFFDANREPIFHYAIFGHQTNFRQATGDCTTGEASGFSGHDFMVTLGGGPYPAVPTFPCWGTDANGFSVGTRSEQAGTFMHELGHTLGLKHGGDETLPNYKVNYLSVMNYSFQYCAVPTSPNGALPGGCDYSRIDLPSPGVPLNEDSLDECIGIGLAAGFGPVNWDLDGILEGITNCQPPNNANVPADINADGIRTLLRGFEDWSHLDYLTAISGDPGIGGVPDEADPQTIQDAQDAIGEVMAPGIVVTKLGPATALPGDVLTFTTQVDNTGRGPALTAVLTDSNPDGATQTSDLGAVLVGDSLSQATSFTVPLKACPGDFTEATATVAFQDFVGHEMTASGSAPLEIIDIVPPDLYINASPSVLWPPYRQFVKVTVHIHVRDDCDLHPDITLVSITSNEPESHGHHDPDVFGANYGTDDRSFYLRAERLTGHHHYGRIYTITYQATDASGNVTEDTTQVRVPTDFHDHH